MTTDTPAARLAKAAEKARAHADSMRDRYAALRVPMPTGPASPEVFDRMASIAADLGERIAKRARLRLSGGQLFGQALVEEEELVLALADAILEDR